jgi:putative ABC transport system substrate-binding protein
VRRREFIRLLGGAAAWPVAARSQQAAMPVIGFLNASLPELYAQFVRAFHRGLNETGYIEGRNVTIDYRWAEDQYDRLPALAAELVRHQVTVIAATSTPAALAARAATTTIPIVFTSGSDPVRLGLVANLSRPGGNVTGATQLNLEVSPKRLELMHELLPTGGDFALLVNPTNPRAAEVQSRDLMAVARSLRLKLHVLHASSEREIETVAASLVQVGARGLVIGAGDAFFNSRSELLGEVTLRHAVPAIYQGRPFAAAGGLISYGGSAEDSYRLAGRYVGRILKGEKPADLPVQQSTKVEMIVNLNTAKALGLSIPLPLLGRADEVIE